MKYITKITNVELNKEETKKILDCESLLKQISFSIQIDKFKLKRKSKKTLKHLDELISMLNVYQNPENIKFSNENYQNILTNPYEI